MELTEIKEKPHRMYYKDDWRCQCGKHDVELQIKGLKNIFDTEKVEFINHVDWEQKQADYFSVVINDSSILSDSIRSAEFHGLMLSSLHWKNDELTLHFTDTGFID